MTIFGARRKDQVDELLACLDRDPRAGFVGAVMRRSGPRPTDCTVHVVGYASEVEKVAIIVSLLCDMVDELNEAPDRPGAAEKLRRIGETFRALDLTDGEGAVRWRA